MLQSPRFIRINLLAASALLATILHVPTMAVAEPAPVHGLAMHGVPKYPASFTHFDYVDPDAPKGGTITLAATGTYDSFNPFIEKGIAAAGIGLIYESLMTASNDEAFSEYGKLAKSAVMPADRSWVAFNIHPNAHWHDGKPVTPEDVIWTFNTLREKGRNFYNTYYADVSEVTKTAERQVTFRFDGMSNQELPLILGQLAVLPKHFWENRDFRSTSLEPPLGSGPYKIVRSEPGRSVTYQRIRDYWGQDLPVNRGTSNFDEIRYEYYRDLDVATEAFKSGAFDFRLENSAKRWATAYDFPALNASKVIKTLLPHERPTGMQAFIFNTRKVLFKDPEVRRALAHAWDFEWTNKTIMYGAYTRTNSYFSNSELSSWRSGLPEGEELDILQRYRGQIPEAVFTTSYQAPSTDGSGNNRANLRQALDILRNAGWKVRDGKLTNDAGEVFAFEMILVQPSLEKLALPFQQSLKRLGIEMSLRTVDTAQYRFRVNNFDFDMIVGTIGQSLSPGNEQRDFWHSSTANRPGSRNVIGIKDPVIDALVDLVIAAPDRDSLVARTRALDRILLWSHYVIPHFHLQASRLVYWNRFGRPPVTAKYSHGFPETWWLDPVKDADLQAWRNRSGK